MTGPIPAADPRSEAVAAGFSVLDDTVALEPEAVRMLPEDAPGIGVAIGGDVLLVATARIPSPDQFRTLEKLSGMAITVAVAGPVLFEQLRARAQATFPAGAPRAIGPVLVDAAAADASDVLLSAGDVPRARVDGKMVPLGHHPVLSARDLEAAVDWALGGRPAGIGGEAETVVVYGDARWRVSTYRNRGNLALSARRMPSRVPRLEDLGLPGAVVELADGPHGLILFAGAAGAGKTTSVAAFVDRINATRHEHILTVESPLEYRHAPLLSTVTQREVGVDVATFAAGVDAAGRHSADVVVIGELRDRASMRAALAAAQSGHLVVATLAANTAQAAVHRVIAFFDAIEQPQVRAELAASLNAIVAQQLLRSAEPGKRELVCEVLLGTDAVRTMIRDGRTHEIAATLETQVRQGMSSMDRSLANYVAAGRLTESVALRACVHPDRFLEHLRRAPGNAAGSSDPQPS